MKLQNQLLRSVDRKAHKLLLSPSPPSSTSQTRRQMVTEHERLTAKLASSRDEVAELNEEVTTLQDTVGKLQRKVLFQRTSTVTS